MIRRILLASLLAATVCARPIAAQATRPWLEWRTLRTEHFDVHFPAEMEGWTRDVASRLEGIHASVGALVGSVPARRVTVVVDDPAGEANGVAYSLLRTPYILLYPTPPDPRSALGHSRGSAEQLAVHEFVHIAHLTRSSRNPFTRWLEGIDPRGLGPLTRTAPRWVREGYATWAEGRLTGYGRPHGVLRAAILRQWALEGRLPTYGQLDATSGPYQLPGMAYLAGSAFLEWLEARRGEESLVHLWRRMSAREERSFEQAFAGVYGGSPQELYGLFTVEVTANALEARRTLASAGLVTGDTVQHLAWGTGDVAVAPDGRHLALTLGGPARSWNRVVVWRMDPPPGDAEEAADSALLARDPEDVAPYRPWPRPRPTVASLRAADGLLPYRAPRFLPGGEEILVVRAAPIGGGATRDDLFAWRWRTGEVRRVTHGASLRSADPLPDGARAVAVQCRGGVCGLVMVDLRTGALAPLAEGTVERVFDRPRVSPDGRTVAAAMQEGGSWKIVTLPVEGGPVTVVHEGIASVYDPVWMEDGASLIVTDERTGIANLARVNVRTGQARALTSVTGAAAAPEVDPATGEVWFLALHGGGWDVHRIDPDRAAAPSITLPATLAPAVQRPAAAPSDTLPRAELPPSRPYGIGPRWTRLLPFGGVDADGGVGGILLHDGDPVGRLSLAARGAWGDEGMERGASASAVWRGARPSLAGDAFFLAQDPSRLAGYDETALDARYAGAALSAANAWTEGRGAAEWRLGASAGWLDGEDAGARMLGHARWALSGSERAGSGFASGSLSLSAAAGTTQGTGWARGLVTTAAGAGLGAMSLRAEATLGRVSRDAPAWERFVLGGSRSWLADEALLSQRLPMPALRWGTLEGTDILTYRVSTGTGAVTPYFWGGTTDTRWNRWLRVAGVEVTSQIPALRAAALPAGRLQAGVAYVLDGPREHDVTAYAGISFAP